MPRTSFRNLFKQLSKPFFGVLPTFRTEDRAVMVASDSGLGESDAFRTLEDCGQGKKLRACSLSRFARSCGEFVLASSSLPDVECSPLPRGHLSTAPFLRLTASKQATLETMSESLNLFTRTSVCKRSIGRLVEGSDRFFLTFDQSCRQFAQILPNRRFYDDCFMAWFASLRRLSSKLRLGRFLTTLNPRSFFLLFFSVVACQRT